MRRDYRVYLEDILEAANNIQEYTSSVSFEMLLDDKKTRDAVVRNLEVIGEAVKHLPLNVRRKHPDVEWQKIAGLRDMLIHEYFGIDIAIVWDIVQNKLPPFRDRIGQILRQP